MRQRSHPWIGSTDAEARFASRRPSYSDAFEDERRAFDDRRAAALRAHFARQRANKRPKLIEAARPWWQRVAKLWRSSK
jgi:hypothetical protein